MVHTAGPDAATRPFRSSGHTEHAAYREEPWHRGKGGPGGCIAVILVGFNLFFSLSTVSSHHRGGGGKNLIN